jgi:hypothetical protein
MKKPKLKGEVCCLQTDHSSMLIIICSLATYLLDVRQSVWHRRLDWNYTSHDRYASVSDSAAGMLAHISKLALLLTIT